MSSSSKYARSIVITGGGSGIGKAVALACAKRGDNVIIFDKDERAAKATAEQAGPDCSLALECDVTCEERVESAFRASIEKFGPPYGLFANAGVDRGGLLHELPLETWRFVVDTNLTGVYLSCKHALRQMLAANVAGSIVCTSSPTGSVALSSGGVAAYSATKAGISALVRCMAVDYARFGIRVNAIVPGATETPLMWRNVPPEGVQKMREQVEKEIPLGRLARPEDPAHGVVWLLSEEANYVTGANLVCDGGILAKASISV